MKCIKCGKLLPASDSGHVHFSFHGEEADFCAICFNGVYDCNSPGLAAWIRRRKEEQSQPLRPAVNSMFHANILDAERHLRDMDALVQEVHQHLRSMKQELSDDC